MSDLVTIAMPVYNRTTYFREALESALNQTHSVPVMVVDNASPDVNFLDLIRPYACDRLSYHRNERNLGLFPNWNRCIDLCRTPYILLLHDDDRLDTGYVAAFHAHYAENTALFFGDVGFIDEMGNTIEKDPIGDREQFRDIIRWVADDPVIMGPIFSVSAAKALGGFDGRKICMPDRELWFKLALAYPYRHIPARSVWYREYNSPERWTTHFERSSKMHGYRRIQYKRHMRLLYESRMIALSKEVPPGGRLPFAELLRLAPMLNDRWLRYATAICLRTSPESTSGKVARPILRILGPLLPRILTGFRKAN